MKLRDLREAGSVGLKDWFSGVKGWVSNPGAEGSVRYTLAEFVEHVQSGTDVSQWTIVIEGDRESTLDLPAKLPAVRQIYLDNFEIKSMGMFTAANLVQLRNCLVSDEVVQWMLDHIEYAEIYNTPIRREGLIDLLAAGKKFVGYRMDGAVYVAKFANDDKVVIVDGAADAKSTPPLDQFDAQEWILNAPANCFSD